MAAVYKTISSNHKSEKNSHGCGPGSGAGWLILWVAPHSLLVVVLYYYYYWLGHSALWDKIKYLLFLRVMPMLGES